MQNRRRLLLGCGLVVAVAPVLGQQAAAIPVVGLLSLRSRAAAVESGIHDAFLHGMRDLGWVQGRNVRYEWRYADGQHAQLQRFAEEFVRLKVDVIVATGTSAVEPARQVTSSIPVVMAPASDPVRSGFVATLARPGGNITGLTSIAVEATPKRLELLVAMVPGLLRVAALLNHNNADGQAFLDEVQSAGRTFNLRTVAVHAGTAEDIDAAFSFMAREGVQAALVAPDSILIAQRRQIVGLAAKTRLPVIYPNREFFDVGGLATYGIHAADIHRRAAAYVDRILKGAKPGELPVEQPSKFELLINLRTARDVGVTIPHALVVRANEVKH